MRDISYPMCFPSNCDGDYLQLNCWLFALRLFEQMCYPYQFSYQFGWTCCGEDGLLAVTLEAAGHPCAVRCCPVCYFAVLLGFWSVAVYWCLIVDLVLTTSSKVLCTHVDHGNSFFHVICCPVCSPLNFD